MTERIKKTVASPFLDMSFKLVVVIIIPWSVWVTNAIFSCKSFQSRGDRFSASDGHRLEKVILEESAKQQNLLFQFEREFSSEYIRKNELNQLLHNNK